MSTTEPTVPLGIALLQKFYQCGATNDRETLRNEVLAPDVIWRIPGRHPMAGPKHGVDEIIAYLDEMATTNVLGEVLYMSGDDSHAIDVHHAWGNTGDTGMDMLFVLYCLVKDGRIADVTAFAHDQAQCDGFFWATFPLAPIPDRLAKA